MRRIFFDPRAIIKERRGGDSRVLSCCPENVGDHGYGRGFPVGAGDADHSEGTCRESVPERGRERLACMVRQADGIPLPDALFQATDHAPRIARARARSL